jgi:hypothetical protein
LTEDAAPEIIYDFLPKTERTLLKHYESYLFTIKNDRGEEYEWFIYQSDKPVGVVTYFKGSKLSLFTIEEKA